MSKEIVNAKIVKIDQLATDVFSIWFEDEMALKARAGQFISVYSEDNARMLPRPISIAEIDKNKKLLRIVFRVVGEGTNEFSKKVVGETLRVCGPLGNGYEALDECKIADVCDKCEVKKVMVVGGGIGIPPMLGLAEELTAKGIEVEAVLGYRHDEFLREEFEKVAKVYIATDDGSDGVHGTVIDAIKHFDLKADVICACGPLPMLRGLKNYANEKDTLLLVSLEEKMGCAIGACLGCVVKSVDVDGHTNNKNKRVCKEGPVFVAREVEF